MATATGQTILLVDDEPDILDTHARLLTHGLPGVAIRKCASGEAALALLADEDVDIVVSDLQMPGMDGMELLATCQQMSPDIYRVLVTAFPDAAEIHEARGAAQLEEIIAKPANPPELIALLKGLLDERAAMVA